MPLNSLFPDKNAVHEPATENLAAAWEELRPELSRLVRALGVGSANADDILQEVYLTAREKCPRHLEFPSPELRSCPERARVREDLRKWLIRVTVNRCRLEHRRTGRWRRAFMALTHLFDRRAQTPPPPSRSPATPNGNRSVRHCSRSIPIRDRSLCCVISPISIQPKSAVLCNCPSATVRGRLCRARQKLADRLRQTGYRHEE